MKSNVAVSRTDVTGPVTSLISRQRTVCHRLRFSHAFSRSWLLHFSSMIPGSKKRLVRIFSLNRSMEQNCKKFEMDKLENNYSWIFIRIDIIIMDIYIYRVISQALQFAWWSSGNCNYSCNNCNIITSKISRIIILLLSKFKQRNL